MYEKYDQNEVAGSQGCQLLQKTLLEMVKSDLESYNDGDLNMTGISFRDYLSSVVGVEYGSKYLF